MAKKALGKGLGALIKPAPNSLGSSNSSSSSGEQVSYLNVNEIVPSPHNPRKEFAETEIQELASSIREHGIIQPLIVRRKGTQYELIAGERRWRASKAIELKVVPAIIRQASDRDVVEMALIENLQRQDLNPIEEAIGYQQLAKEFELKQEDIAKRVGKSRASVANAMRLLDLNESIQSYVANGQLTVGHAKVILSVKDKSHQAVLADQVIRQKFTVRQTEKAVQNLLKPVEISSPSTVQNDAYSTELANLQNRLRDYLSSRVLLTNKGKKGKIEIEFYNEDDLERILHCIGLPEELG